MLAGTTWQPMMALLFPSPQPPIICYGTVQYCMVRYNRAHRPPPTKHPPNWPLAWPAQVTEQLTGRAPTCRHLPPRAHAARCFLSSRVAGNEMASSRALWQPQYSKYKRLWNYSMQASFSVPVFSLPGNPPSAPCIGLGLFAIDWGSLQWTLQ